MTSSPTKHIDYYDSLRVLAMLAVVTIHLATPVLKMSFSAKGLNASWLTGDVFTSMTRFAVPLFLMLSGATMLGRQYQYCDFLKKRFTRILIPFLFFTVFFIIFKLFFDRPEPHVSDLSGLFSWIGDKYIECGLSQHFWYVYMLLVIYPLVPLAQRLLSKDRCRRVLDSLLILWAVYLCLFHSAPLSPFCIDAPESVTKSNLFSSVGAYFLFRKVVSYLIYFGYVLLGFRLSVMLNGVSGRSLFVSKVIALLAYLCSVAFCAVCCAKGSAQGRLDLSAQGYMHINTLLQSIAVFMLFAGTDISTASNKFSRLLVKARNSISACSYGIYLLHIMVISVLWNYGIYWKICNPVISIPLLVLFVTLVSWAIICVVKRIPGGRFIVG